MRTNAGAPSGSQAIARERIENPPGALAPVTIDSPQSTPELSVVIPVYGCERCLETLHERLAKALDGMGVIYQIIFVEDRGKDDSWRVVEALAGADPHTIGLRLNRNYGQVAAIEAGLREVRSGWSVVMDCDLQDPPELIPKLWEHGTSGTEIVMARHAGRAHQVWRKLASRSYFALLRALGGHPLLGRCGAYSLISKRVRDRYLSSPSRRLSYVVNLFESRVPIATVDFRRDPRPSGRSGYTFLTLIAHGARVAYFVRKTLLKLLLTGVGLGLLLAGLGLATGSGSAPLGAMLVLGCGGSMLALQRRWHQLANAPDVEVGKRVGTPLTPEAML